MTILSEFNAWLRIPTQRCYLSLGLLCVALTILVIAASAGQSTTNGYYNYNRPGPGFLFEALKYPVVLFLPLFFVARNYALTPVTLSLAFSMSTGLLVMSIPLLILVAGFGGRLNYRTFEFLFYCNYFYLLGWFLYSFIQAATFTNYGFSSSLTFQFLLIGPMVGLFGLEFPALLFTFGFFYFLTAARGLSRVYQISGKAASAVGVGPIKTPPARPASSDPLQGLCATPGSTRKPPGNS